MPRNDLAEIASSAGFPRVSIYIPTHKTFPDAEQDPIRLSNALKDAEEQLEEADIRDPGELLAAARQRLEDYNFWHYQKLADHPIAPDPRVSTCADFQPGVWRVR